MTIFSFYFAGSEVTCGANCITELGSVHYLSAGSDMWMGGVGQKSLGWKLYRLFLKTTKCSKAISPHSSLWSFWGRDVWVSFGPKMQTSLSLTCGKEHGEASCIHRLDFEALKVLLCYQGRYKTFCTFCLQVPPHSSCLYTVHNKHSPNRWLLANEKTEEWAISMSIMGTLRLHKLQVPSTDFQVHSQRRAPYKEKNNHSLNNSSFLVVHCNSYDKIMVDTLYLRPVSDRTRTFVHWLAVISSLRIVSQTT